MSQPEPWIPPDTLTDHSGRPIPSDRLFFVPPVPQLGILLSAASQVKQSKRPFVLPAVLRWAIVGLITIAIGLIGAAFSQAQQNTVGRFGSVNEEDTAAERAAAAVTSFVIYAVIGGIVGTVMTSKRAYLTYIGTEGVMRAAYPPSPKGLRRGELLLFRDLEDVRGVTKHQYRSSAPTALRFRQNWRDFRGNTLLRIVGVVRYGAESAEQEANLAFCVALERAWFNHMRTRAHYFWGHGEPLRFAHGKSGRISLWPAVMETHGIGKTERIPLAEIQDVQFSEGWLKLTRVPGGGAPTQRPQELKFYAMNLGNAGVLAALLHELRAAQRVAAPV